MKDYGELSSKQQEVYICFAKLAERQSLIQIAIVETVLKIIDRLPFEWSEMDGASGNMEGKVRLETPEIGLAVTNPAQHLLACLTEKPTIIASQPHEIDCVVKRERQLNFIRLRIKLVYEQSSLALNLTWFDREVIEGATVEFSDLGLRNWVLQDQYKNRVSFSDERWRNLESAAALLMIIDKSKIVAEQEAGSTNVA
ncbi:hypothetical protein HYZ70_03505 [Candidatus Curtissbacteria bacterium]|nr:hypothetical protein [Candidatus Curtissbacteria bacterium]